VVWSYRFIDKDGTSISRVREFLTYTDDDTGVSSESRTRGLVFVKIEIQKSKSRDDLG
jgi:hypothetical protein